MGATAVTSTSFAQKATVTFTSEASTTYWIIASVRMGMGSAQGGFRIRDVTGSTTPRGEVIKTAKDPSLTAGDNETELVIDRFQSGASASQQFDLEIRSVSGASASFDKATLLVLKADPADEYAESEGDTTSSSATLVDKTTLTFTPATTGDYLVLASALTVHSASGQCRVQLDKNAAATIYADASRASQAATDVFTWSTMAKQTALSGSNTFKIRFAGTTSTGTIRQASILALRLDQFLVAQYAESRTRTTTTAATYQDKATLTFTPTAKSHLIFACGLLDGTSNTASFYANFDKGGTSQIESLHESKTATAANNVHAFHWMQVQTLTTSSTTWKTQSKVETVTSTTAGFAESAIAVLELTSTVVNDTVVPAGVSATGQVGTVTVSVSAPSGDVNVSPTGTQATGQVGTVTVSTTSSASVNATGVQGAGQVGTVAPSGGASVTVSNVAATGQVGTVTPSGSASITETGVFATGQVGTVSVSVTANPSVTVTGVQATGAVGTVTVTGNASVSVTGVSAAGAVGTATVTTVSNPSVTVTGVAATGQVGEVTVTAGGNVAVGVNGVSATGQVGTAGVTTTANVSVTGVMGTGQIGTVVVQTASNVTVFPNGTFALGQVGTVQVTIDGTQPPEEEVPSAGGTGEWRLRRKKRRPVIRYSDYSTQEAYAAALSQAAIPLTQVSDEGYVEPEDDFEDDDEILFAIVRILH